LWNKFCASSWLNTEINILRCTVSITSKSKSFRGRQFSDIQDVHHFITTRPLSCLYHPNNEPYLKLLEIYLYIWGWDTMLARNVGKNGQWLLVVNGRRGKSTTSIPLWAQEESLVLHSTSVPNIRKYHGLGLFILMVTDEGRQISWPWFVHSNGNWWRQTNIKANNYKIISSTLLFHPVRKFCILMNIGVFKHPQFMSFF